MNAMRTLTPVTTIAQTLLDLIHVAVVVAIGLPQIDSPAMV